MAIAVQHERVPVAFGEHMLWYTAPAAHWDEALPVGDGHRGAMVFGGCPTERLQFNDQTLWTGADGTQKWLDSSRSDERTRDGAIGAFQPFGDVFVSFGNEHASCTDYRRELDLATGVALTRYEVGGVVYTRRVFVSRIAGVVVMRVEADRPGGVNVGVSLRDAARPPMEQAGTVAGADGLRFEGAFTPPASAPAGARQFNGMRYCAALRVICEGGRGGAMGAEWRVEGSNAVTVLLAFGTDYAMDPERGYRGEDPAPRVAEAVARAAEVPFERLYDEHCRAHRALFERVTLSLPRTANSDLPTDQRIMAYTAGAADPALEALTFQYGRYLLISSSRPGGLPANLQGLWNDNPQPAWYSGYTTNINVEMNYWLAETANLAECATPLFDYIDHLAEAQKRNPDPKLRTDFGWVIYSTNNPLGGNSGWGIHLPGSAWLSQHLFEAWAFGRNVAFLKTRAYPHLRELARMWDARLVENADAELITPDGWSPEHGPVRGADGVVRIVGGDRTPQPGASYDQFIVHDLFSNFIEASEALGEDAELREHIRQRRGRLLGPKVGRWGQLREWMEDVDDPADTHRHISHLFAVHPGRQVSPGTTPDLAAAARVSLDARGDGSCGWSRAWKLCHWARLCDGNRAHKLIRNFLTYIPAGADHAETERRGGAGVLPNLFCVHPPFQIDGNLGFSAGVAEMLLQSHLRTEDGRRIVHLLPALPDAWATGAVQGLRARGGLTVDLAWAKGKLLSATLRSTCGGRLRVVCQSTEIDLDLSPGQVWRLGSGEAR